jgi:hypothetical protein
MVSMIIPALCIRFCIYKITGFRDMEQLLQPAFPISRLSFFILWYYI